MDTMQRQIGELTDQVQRLYVMIERISEQLAQLSIAQQQSLQEAALNKSTHGGNSNSHEVIEHKDVLQDHNGWDHNNSYTGESAMPPEVQITRLTAQLTAAYNRIAALEEQLLARRSLSH